MTQTYSESQLHKSALEYFNNDELAAKVWMNKYALKINGEYVEISPDDTIKRVATEIKRAEDQFPNPLSYDEIYKNLKNFKNFIFAGSILFGSGNPNAVSLGNCFFIDNEADSYGGIFNLDESIAQLMKRRGGVGITLEHLRPKYASVNNSAQSSTGAVSFMNRYSNTTREVAQDGRRGALMISLHVQHPDIEDFINAKDDLTQITGANVSVKMTDEFMEAAKNDQDFYLAWPIQKGQPTIDEQIPYNKTRIQSDGSYVKRVKARDIWEGIIKMAHKNAEPGVLFWDNIIKESPADMYADDGFETRGTNPCITGDTLIAVADGRNAVSIKQLVEEGRDVPVYSTNPNSGQKQIKWARNPRLTKSKTKVWKLTLDDGSHLIATPDHSVLTKDLNYVELKDLRVGDSITPFYSFDSNNYRQISGVGAKMIGGNYRNRRQYRTIYEFYNGSAPDSKIYAIHHKDCNNKNDAYDNLMEMTHEDHREFHAKNMRGDLNPYHKMTAEWKRNFASHKGESNGKYSGFTNNEILTEAKKIFKAKGKFTRKLWYAYAEQTGMPKNIGNDFRFKSFTNFKHQVCENHKVKSIEFYGYEDVFNITVDDNHNYDIITKYEDDNYVVSSGITIRNCGEVPLSSHDSCRLGSINIAAFIDKPYTSKARVKWAELARMTRMAQRFMDDVITLEEEKINKILKKLKKDPEAKNIKRTEIELWAEVLRVLQNGRRTGLGMLGLGDALASLGITYGSKKATKVAEEIAKVMAINSYRESVNLAKERGAFLLWDADKEAGNPFIMRVISNNFDNKEYEQYLNTGRRNIANLSIAPTGSLAIEAQTTSSMEPVFKCFFYRVRKVNANEENVKVDYVDDNGDSWEEYYVLHAPFERWCKNEKEIDPQLLNEKELNELVAQSPWAGSESHNIDYKEKVNMQGAIQKWVDHAISVTHNLPEDISVEAVNDIYFQAWKAGCKGCTIYREGSRSGVLSTKKKSNEEDFLETTSPKRPKELPADYYSATAQGKKFAVIVGLYKNKPYEFFAFENPPSDKNTRGKIIKIRKGHYKFINGDFEIDNLELASNRIEERSLTLTISAMLRHGVKVDYINKIVQKVDENISSFSSVVRRYLSRYADAYEIDGEACPECGDKLITESGCVQCISCGYSRC